MSLISDALRKARQEASEREARARGVVPPPGPAGGGPRPGLGTGIVIGGLIAAIATLAGGAAVWWALGSGGTPAPAATEVAAATITPAAQIASAPSAEPASPGAASPTAVRTATDSRSPVEPAAATTATPLPSATPTPPPAPDAGGTLPPLIVDDSATGKAEPASESPPAASPRAAPEATAGPRLFGLAADLGYARLELGYLIYRPDDPFAEINGVEVHVGSRIEGFRVDEISKTSIRLSDDRGEVILRVR